MKPEDDQKLSQLLRQWEPGTEVPPRFRSSVWSQIAARQERRSFSILERLNAFFARPAYAGAAAALALLMSIGVAHQHAGHVVSERRAMAEGSYLNSISPLARVSADGATLAMNHGHEPRP